MKQERNFEVDKLLNSLFLWMKGVKMIKEIYSFELYEDFIRDFSGKSDFSDPHFEFDNGNLYESLNNGNKKAYIISDGEKINGLFVWLVLSNEKYIEMLIGLSKEESAIREMLTFI